MEKIGVVARSVSWNAARLVMKLTAPLDTFISVEPFAIALSYLNLKDRQQMHYTMNSKLETGDKGSIDLYAAFHNSIKAGDMVTLGLLVQKYKEKNPGKRIEFSTPAGVMDGLFLVVGTENPRLAAIQLFMETGCNPNSEYNGKTPLGILTDYQAKHSSLEVAHAVVYMQGMASLLEQHAKRQATGSITAAPAQQLAIGDSSKEVCHNPDGCIEDAPQE